MGQVYNHLETAYESIKNKIPFTPKVALVLGSGLGGYADELGQPVTISYSEITGFPVSTAPGHKGRFVFGYVGNTPVVCMQGRIHYYEGYSMEQVVMPIRLMHMMGAEILFLTNAAGGINHRFHAGDLMMITDQISMFVPSPLNGPNEPEIGTRFPDMTHVYDKDLCRIVEKSAIESEIDLQRGCYVQTQGPQYESCAEVALCRMLGADAVGMSTACEAIAGHHAGMRVVGVSCITNMAAGISPTPLNEQEVIEAGKAASKKFTNLVTKAVQMM